MGREIREIYTRRMSAEAFRVQVETKGDQLLQIIEAHRAAPVGSVREREMETMLAQAADLMTREPEVTASVAVFLANFICAMNESLPPRNRMWPAPRPGAGSASTHRAPGAW